MKLAFVFSLVLLGMSSVFLAFGLLGGEGLISLNLQIAGGVLFAGVMGVTVAGMGLMGDFKKLQAAKATLALDHYRREQDLAQEKASSSQLQQKLSQVQGSLDGIQTEKNRLQMLNADLESKAESLGSQLEKIQKKLGQLEALRETTESRDALALLTLLQERGRLIDFLMEDITAYGDAQVGAAARIIHQGCRKVLQECFSLAPITESKEGQKISLGTLQKELMEPNDTGAGHDDGTSAFAALYRLIGRVPDRAPLQLEGTLVHRGWKAKQLHVPKRVQSLEAPAPFHHVVVPVEIEV